jgi:hypothetical protein
MDTESVGGAALTAFENTASKPMQKILQNVHDRAAEATATDRALAEALRASGRGIRVETISPCAAAIIILQWNQFNRNISIPKCEQMVADLKSGDWRVHHQGIAFTRDGDLADGQHRLISCAVSGIPMTVAVASDFDMSAIDAIDRSTRRTLDQVLQMQGVPDAKDKVRIGPDVVKVRYRISFGLTRTPNLSEHQMRKEISKIDSALADAIGYGKASTRNVSDPILKWEDAAKVAAVLLLSQWGPNEVTAYLVSIQEGIAAYDNSPTIALCRVLAKGKESKEKLDTIQRIALTLKAAVLFRQNKRVSRLTWNEMQEGIPDPTPLELAS